MFSKLSKPKSSKSNTLQVIDEEQIDAKKEVKVPLKSAVVKVTSERTVTDINDSFYSFEKVITQKIQENPRIEQNLPKQEVLPQS